jgi:uncharacterized protein YqgC (DUF456 family)
MQQKARTTIRTAFGIFLVVFGFAGMILPILPGWWLIPIGLQILGWKLVIDRKKPWGEIIKIKRKNKEDESVE